MGYPIPYSQYVAVAASDTVDFDIFTKQDRLTAALYIGTGGGDVACVDESGTATVFTAVPAGTFLPVAVRRVNASGTAATSIVACYWV
jgi:hypothetical protein